MPDETHYRRLENMYFSAQFNRAYATSLNISAGRAEAVMPVREDRFHVLRAAHGAVYFKAMDDTAFFAAQSLVEDAFLLTLSFNLYFLKPINSGAMHAVAECVSAGSRQWIAEAIVRNDDGIIIARGSGVFVKSRVSLSEDIGYRL